MNRQQVTRNNQQSKNEIPLVRGILQRAAVRSQDEESSHYTESRFHQDFSRVPVTDTAPTVQAKSNKTGLPDKLKAGIENLSGMAMDDVRVHYNSSKPSQLQALAYTQGTDIHVGTGQERHLPHEAWHVVQQKQGRVKPTIHAKGEAINDNQGLEKEADVMGGKALQDQLIQHTTKPNSNFLHAEIIQMVWIEEKKGLFYWHALRDGVRWVFNENTNIMFFQIERTLKALPEETLQFYKKYENQESSYEDWLLIMSKEFDIKIDELEDKDDPIFENPIFLMEQEDSTKIETGKSISAALGAMGLKVFLGGAASATLFTRTRPINDLDLRLDGLNRNAFDGEEGEKLLIIINKALNTGELKLTQSFEIVAKTTIRGEVNGIEVSITSEPTKETTLTRGEMIPGLESLGQFDFLLDKAFAAANRPKNKIESVATDVYDIIKTRESLPGGGAGILKGLDALRGEGLADKLIPRLEGLAGEGKLKGQLSRGRNSLIKGELISEKELKSHIELLIKELKSQTKVTVR